ncbi:hypothetical protein [Sandaracinus amylolyticus]|uniref:hypothetical protein n=1 Tax=Sandaracinus amylolyticus TaxID=927083 RepID=UPI001F2750CA|nr:hypothetical protein [Sandaracinus amylolyticus]UJR86585.1 Hypothetical protein I5071_86860 [Sandaracinus amylolyticus]
MRSIAIVLVAVLAQGCCCFGGEWLAPPASGGPSAEEHDRPLVELARRYVEEHAQEIVGPVDAGAASASQECLAAIAMITAAVVVPVITRGHAGSELAAEVRFDLAQCARSIVVQLVHRAGVWVALAATVIASGSVPRTVGEPSPWVFVPGPPPSTDVDVGIDELFD